MKETSNAPLFTYGSLMVGKHNHEQYLAGKIFGKVLSGRIKGELYDLPYKGYPAVLEGDDWVYGEVFELKSFHETITAMDEMEHFYDKDSTKNEYERYFTKIYVWNEEKQDYCDERVAYCYHYVVENDPRFAKESVYLPHGDWHEVSAKEEHQLSF